MLFIGGAFGDCRAFSHVADQLADRYHVIAYERRGNSRSEALDRWYATSLELSRKPIASEYIVLQSMWCTCAQIFRRSALPRYYSEMLARIGVAAVDGKTATTICVENPVWAPTCLPQCALRDVLGRQTFSMR